ncbi:phage protein [Sulfuriferula multivorans]|uniref:Phage protein n=1 Tax=Sulfuriferula multivorans TaxID=1559896 RepID=A0A401JF33_9PROT|nr:peptidase [Sulfuriferula multivorans]GBL46230.1 phage protein [Sulfuriferula multivorans]
MANTQLKPIHFFRAGRHTDMAGRAIEFSQADLDAAAVAYDPAVYRAPIVVGHPQLDAPAYGWVDKVASDADGLHAQPVDVEAQFADLVRAKRYRHVSGSFFPPAHPRNPVPGAYYLKHIGFLGAAAPAIRGLKQVEFADDDADLVTVEFADAPAYPVASLFRSLRDWMIEKFDLATADQVIPGYQVDSLTAAAAQPDDPADTPQPAFSAPQGESTTGDTPMTDADRQRLAQLEADNAALRAREAEFSEATAEMARLRAETRHAENVSFVDGLITRGRLLPADRLAVVAYMDGPDDTGVIAFGEGGDAKSLPAIDWFRSFLVRLPEQVSFAEHSAAGDDADTAAFAAPDGYGTDPGQMEIHRQTLAYAAANKTDYLTAVQAVTKGAAK